MVAAAEATAGNALWVSVTRRCALRLLRPIANRRFKEGLSFVLRGRQEVRFYPAIELESARWCVRSMRSPAKHRPLRPRCDGYGSRTMALSTRGSIQALDRGLFAGTSYVPALEAVSQSYSRTAVAKAETAGEGGRSATETSDTARTICGSATMRWHTPGWLAENSAMKQTPIPAATIARIQSSRSLR